MGKHTMKIARTLIGAALLAGAMAGAQAATLDVVRERGELRCGTTTGFAGFSAPDAKGVWRGLDVDLCRAIAAAVFGDAGKIKVVPLNSQQRFTRSEERRVGKECGARGEGGDGRTAWRTRRGVEIQQSA